LGEAREDVFVIGSPELDVHRAPSGVTLAEVRARYEIPFDDFGIVLFHPVTSEQDTIGAQARMLFDALQGAGRAFVVISPNNDPGSEQIFSAIAALPTASFRHIPSMRFAYFSELMRNAAAVVGNSSLGVREAPFLGVPSLNVGTRQTNRARSGSVIHADASDSDTIAGFLSKNWGKRHQPDNSFGAGDAAGKFVTALAGASFWQRGRQKLFIDQR
ncbi:MAG: UDP-N-acetylglucosamine 2-epimerase, partial [Halocynthiibacter sp.]